MKSEHYRVNPDGKDLNVLIMRIEESDQVTLYLTGSMRIEIQDPDSKSIKSLIDTLEKINAVTKPKPKSKAKKKKNLLTKLKDMV